MGPNAGCGTKRGKVGKVSYNAVWERVKERWKTPNTPINPQVEHRVTSSPKIPKRP